MTLIEVKKDILNVLKGEIIREDLRDYIENPGEFTEEYTPAMWLFNFTEIKIKKKVLDSIYCIPVKKEKQSVEFVHQCKIPTAKECLMFLRTNDGINIADVHTIFPFGISLEEMNRINERIRYYISK